MNQMRQYRCIPIIKVEFSGDDHDNGRYHKSKINFWVMGLLSHDSWNVDAFTQTSQFTLHTPMADIEDTKLCPLGEVISILFCFYLNNFYVLSWNQSKSATWNPVRQNGSVNAASPKISPGAMVHAWSRFSLFPFSIMFWTLGSHKGTEYVPSKWVVPEGMTEGYFCQCKLSGKKPLCDGTRTCCFSLDISYMWKFNEDP